MPRLAEPLGTKPIPRRNTIWTPLWRGPILSQGGIPIASYSFYNHERPYCTATETWWKHTIWRNSSSQHVESSVGRIERDPWQVAAPSEPAKVAPKKAERYGAVKLWNVFVSDNRGFHEFRSWQWLVLSAKRNLFVWIWSNMFRVTGGQNATRRRHRNRHSETICCSLDVVADGSCHGVVGHQWAETGICDCNGWLCSGWWFGTCFIFLLLLGISSSQWTNSYFSEG